MGEEIGQGFTISDLQAKDQANLTLEETNEGSHFKDDVIFVLLIVISPHTIIMLNEIDNLLGLDAILNGKPIRLRILASQQHGSKSGESSGRGDNSSY